MFLVNLSTLISYSRQIYAPGKIEVLHLLRATYVQVSMAILFPDLGLSPAADHCL